MSDEAWWVTTFDEVVAEQDEDGGARLRDTEKLVVDRYVEAVLTKRLPRPERLSLEMIGQRFFDQFVRPERQRRREHMRTEMDYIIDALDDPDSGATVAPILDKAFLLGSSDGRDRILALWTADNYSEASIVRYRNAAMVTAAAAEFDQRAQVMIEKLREAGATYTRDLYA